MSTLRLILASASPRRQELLTEAGYRFTVHPSDIDESAHASGLTAASLASELSIRKAQTVSGIFPEDVVLAADTVVSLRGEIFGKAADRIEARRLLEILSGSDHAVLTGVCVMRQSDGFSRSCIVESTVHMCAITSAEIEAYLDTDAWRGKAGAYGIQDPDPFVSRITGSVTNIVGLPIDETRELLAEAGIFPQARSRTSATL